MRHARPVSLFTLLFALYLSTSSSTLSESTAVIRAPEAWAAGVTGAGQAVAILDIGVDGDHPFLGGRVVYEECFGSLSMTRTPLCAARVGAGAAKPCNAEGCDHGTQVAGIAAGSGPTFQGVAPGASLIAMQIYVRYFEIGMSASEYIPFEANAALQRIYELRTQFNIAAVLLNKSENTAYACNGWTDTLIDRLAAVGIPTVVASGNGDSASGLSSTGCVASAVTVGSTRDGGPGGVPLDTVSPFSNSAPSLDFLAPGEWITSSVPHSGYRTNAGTSLAAAHVAGAFALLRQRQAGASLPRLLDALRAGGVPITDSRNGVTTPRLDVAAALDALGPPCEYALNPATITIGAGGTGGRLFVTAGGHCEWRPMTASPYLSFAAPTVAQGSGSVDFEITPNTTTATRTTIAKIAGQTFTVVQMPAASPCAYAITPEATSVGREASIVTVSVATDPYCEWTATASGSQIVVSSGATGSGPGTVVLHIHENFTPAARTLTATIAGRTLTVTQAAGPPACSYAISPASVSISNARTSGDVVVTTASHCNWFATSNSSLLELDTIPSPGYRTGPGTIHYSVVTNWQTSPRTLTASIADHTFTVNQGAAPVLPRPPDISGDWFMDLIWQNRQTGQVAVWEMSGIRAASTTLINGGVPDPAWRIAATADMDGDAKLDLVWQHDMEGWLAIWKMDRLTLVSSLSLSVPRIGDTDWKIVAAQDFDRDGKQDLVWHHRTLGYLALWLMDGTTVRDSVLFSPGRVADTNWVIEAAHDFNSDGHMDLLWRHQTEGMLTVWFMQGTQRVGGGDFTPERVTPNWRVAGAVDWSENNIPTLIWQDTVNGWIAFWSLLELTCTDSALFIPSRVEDTNWRIVGPK